jgi:hypothetical protein
MKTRIILTIFLSLFTTIILILTISGCQQKSDPQSEIPPDPFVVVWGPGNEYVVTFIGDSAGHTAGEISEFTLKLDNNSSYSWQGEYFIDLLGNDKIVMEITHDTFEVPARIELEIVVSVELESTFDGPYGLSLYIPECEAQSIQTIWIGEKRTLDVDYWPSRVSHPWLWSESMMFTEDEARELAGNFVKNSPTFKFDGIEDTFQLVETLYPDIENAWQFIFQFESRQAGYGNRVGQTLLQVITPHEVVVTIEHGEVISALMDSKWDMIEQRMLDNDNV